MQDCGGIPDPFQAWVHHVSHVACEQHPGRFENIDVVFPAVLAQHMNAELRIATESMNRLAKCPNITQADVWIGLDKTPRADRATVLERHVEPPEILNDMIATLWSLKRLGRMHDGGIDALGIQQQIKPRAVGS